jgi:hypothetical protein
MNLFMKVVRRIHCVEFGNVRTDEHYVVRFKIGVNYLMLV